jgi:OOP family OmpA-OmpF porin
VIRLGVRLVDYFDIEGEVGRVEGKTRDLRVVYHLYNPRGSVLFHVTPNARADLFFGIGAGMQFVKVERESQGAQPDGNDRALYVNPSSDFVMDAGPGLILHAVGPFHLRTDLRWYGTFGPDSQFAQSDSFQNLEWTLGVDFRQEERPDRDGDGIKNKVDDCPDDPEDFDNFQDDDGCPEADNDGDGIKDKRDQCPDEKEDIDEWEDTDGCPDPDNDGDGIKDKKDRCPDNAEDMDGFDDDDGCPDKDNDDDGVNDKRDRCPDEPETLNGFQDGDGCPDELPREVKKFSGVIQGITFETNKAVIRSESFPTLIEALAVFLQHPELQFEVQGHTDDVGDDRFNLDLSQRRAEAVMIWFLQNGLLADRMRAIGYGETIPMAENTSDAGRAQNRRVEFRLLNVAAADE